MKTVTESFNIYSFSELSETAKQRAKDDHANLFGYNWADDALKSLSALAKHFDGTLSDYSVDFFNCSHSSVVFTMPEMEEDEIKERLSKLGSFCPDTLRGHGDCVLTGFHMDESAIDGFRGAWAAGHRHLDQLMEASGESWLDAVHEDCADQYSDESFSEFCEMNEYRFREDGSFYRH